VRKLLCSARRAVCGNVGFSRGGAGFNRFCVLGGVLPWQTTFRLTGGKSRWANATEVTASALKAVLHAIFAKMQNNLPKCCKNCLFGNVI